MRTSCRVVNVVCSLALVWLGLVAPAMADRRVALVIGNGAYLNQPHLSNPAHDAEDVAAALERSGFEVIKATDLTLVRMQDAAIAFARAARTADVALFYYSGHALQFGGVNYLAPVNATLVDEADLHRMIRVADILEDLQQAKNLRILVLDSCRNNPFAETLRRAIGSTRAASIGRGLAPIEAPSGTIVAYSTQSGQVAEDGGGRNSPFSSAFIRRVEEKEEIGAVFRRVAIDVYEATKHAQFPELSMSLTAEFYLNGKAEAAAAPTDESAQAWAAVKDTSSIAVLDAFIEQYGQSLYGRFARARREELRSRESAAAAQAEPASAPLPRPDSADRIRRFITFEYLQDHEHFAPMVDYFDKGLITREAALQDRVSYASKWPQRHFELIDGTLDVKALGAGAFAATFGYTFQVSNGTKSAAGRGVSTVTLRIDHEEILVTGVKETVQSRSRPARAERRG
jgi:uncharacterized caspase-like protein